MSLAKSKSKSFKYEHVWRILIEYEKFALQSVDHHSGKKAKTFELGAYTSSSDWDKSINEDDVQVHTHPIGQNMAKNMSKAKSGVYENLKESMDKTVKEFRGHT